MTTSTRRERDFAARERCILEHARALIAEKGFLNLQMAELARCSEYATGTLYQHVACKEDILFLVWAEGLRVRQQLLARVAAWDAPSRDRMTATGYADWLFVESYPDHFRLEQLARAEDVWMRATPAVRDRAMSEGERCAQIAFSIVDDAVTAGDLQLIGQTPRQIAFGFWTMSVGTHAMVHAADALQRLDVRHPYATLARNYQALLNALNWQPLADPTDAGALDAFFDRLHAELFSDFPAPHHAITEDAAGPS